MSRRTETRYLRAFDWDKDKVGTQDPIKGFRTMKGRGVMTKRKEILPATSPTNMGACAGCGRDVYASPGQVILMLTRSDGTRVPSHKACRKAAKKARYA